MKTSVFCFVVLLVFVLSNSNIATASDCAAPEARHVAHLKTIAQHVESDNFGATRAFVDQVWSEEESRASWKFPALEGLGAWMKQSRVLTEEEFCVDQQGRPSGYFHNPLTGMIDLVRFRIDENDSNRMASLDVRVAVRSKENPKTFPDERSRIEALREYIAGLGGRDVFSGSVLLARDGQPLLFESYGYANKEARTLIDEGSIFNLASLNKIFTAVSILQLVEKGQLQLDTQLLELIPDQVESKEAGQIQIQHLLSHTSGAMSGLGELDFAPGTDYAYSNFGFGVLGDVIEQVSSLSYNDYIRLYILGPAGMAQTANYQLLNSEKMVPDLVYGYGPDLEADTLKFVPNPYLQIYPGGPVGGYYATAGDLLKFAQSLKSGTLLGKEFLALMRTAKTELGAEEYGFGTMLWRGPGIWGHAGDLPGADADMEFYGDTGLVAIVLGNYDENNPPVLMKIRSLFFPESIVKD